MRNINRFVLSDKEAIINKGKNRNWNSEIFKPIF